MFRYSHRLFLISALIFILYYTSEPEAAAMEPVTIAMMAAPIVIPIVKAMIPYFVKGGVNFFTAMVDVFVDMSGFFLLPFGMLESTVGAPFGLFKNGLYNMGQGCLAPFKMGWSMIRVPVRIFTG
jgi:hypothetical protein